MKSFFVILSTVLVLSSAQFDYHYRPNNNRGLDLGASYTRQAGNFEGRVFGQGALNSGNSIKITDPVYGASGAFNKDGNSLSYQHSRGQHSTQDAIRGTAKIFDNGENKVNVNAWHERTRLHKRQINRFDRYGGNVEWQHRNGHSASIGVDNVPQFHKQTIDANANANIWQSRDGNAKLGAYGQASHNVGQFQHGKTNYEGGLKFEAKF